MTAPGGCFVDPANAPGSRWAASTRYRLKRAPKSRRLEATPMQVGHARLLQQSPDILLIPGTMKKRSVMTCCHRVLAASGTVCPRSLRAPLPTL